MSLEHSVGIEGKEMLKTNNQMGWGVSDPGVSLAPRPNLEQVERQNEEHKNKW